MTDSKPPPNIYRVAQRRFDAVPGAPWAYWISERIRGLFEEAPCLKALAQPRQGLATADNVRFVRYWWEVGRAHIGLGYHNCLEASKSHKKWFPYMKGGTYRKWYGNQTLVVNWCNDGAEIRNYYGDDGRIASRPQNTGYYFREGVTWGDLNPTGFAVRYSPGGFIFDVKGSSSFPASEDTLFILALMNSAWTQYALDILNPTASFQVGDISRVPVVSLSDQDKERLTRLTILAVRLRIWESMDDETTFDFLALPRWPEGLADTVAVRRRLLSQQTQIDGEILRLYGISPEDRVAIEDELRGDMMSEERQEHVLGDSAEAEDEPEPIELAGQQTTAACWISYAVGVVLGRFQPGVSSALGAAMYHRRDFAVGSLPAPEEAAFDALVGPVERFAYVDPEDSRHIFAAEVEAALCTLAVPDGITVLDKGHPRDLPALVERALDLMLGEKAAQEVIAAGAEGNLRRFLERDFFTKWHLRWYRKRPVYWPLQSARRSYGFVLFHERVDATTLYTLQRDYLDIKLNGLRQQLVDLAEEIKRKSGAERRKVERELDEVRQLLDELEQFAQTMARIVDAGYKPAGDWIDDGVILRLAPLWELIPIWPKEPKTYWERLQRGEYDWSHIAMRYWPERVREKCRTNKSFAIAHGHEEWYE